MLRGALQDALAWAESLSAERSLRVELLDAQAVKVASTLRSRGARAALIVRVAVLRERTGDALAAPP